MEKCAEKLKKNQYLRIFMEEKQSWDMGFNVLTSEKFSQTERRLSLWFPGSTVEVWIYYFSLLSQRIHMRILDSVEFMLVCCLKRSKIYLVLLFSYTELTLLIVNYFGCIISGQIDDYEEK